VGGSQPLERLVLGFLGQQLAEEKARQRRWEVPLVTVPSAERFDGQATLHLAGVDLLQVETLGLFMDEARRDQANAAVPSGTAASQPSSFSWGPFRYGHPPIALTLLGSIPKADRSMETLVDHARLISHLGPDGRWMHRFRFQVWNWK